MATAKAAGNVEWYGMPWTAGSATISRTFDWLVVVILYFAVTGAFQIHFILLGGDWDFWVDWKDRQWWPVVLPIVTIMFPAALQQIFWVNFRLPLGATFAALTLVLAEWISRVQGFHWWTDYPLSFVWPATIIPSALVLDAVLLLTGNFLLTAIIGGAGFALLFYPSNWPMLAPYHLAMEVQGILMSVADYMGFGYVRTATPEYIRLIERGTLRTFGGHSAVIAAFFAAFVCILTYIVWWYFGALMSRIITVPNQLRKYMGIKDEAKAPAASTIM